MNAGKQNVSQTCGTQVLYFSCNPLGIVLRPSYSVVPNFKGFPIWLIVLLPFAESLQ